MKQKTIEQLAREEQARYHREWRARNKDKVKEANRRYWAKRALERRTAEQKKECEQ